MASTSVPSLLLSLDQDVLDYIVSLTYGHANVPATCVSLARTCRRIRGNMVMFARSLLSLYPVDQLLFNLHRREYTIFNSSENSLMYFLTQMSESTKSIGQTDLNRALLHYASKKPLSLRGVNRVITVIQSLISFGACLSRTLCMVTLGTRAIKTLIALGADPNARDGCPLITCCTYGNLEGVRILLDFGAKPESRNNMAIKLAAKYGYTKIVKLLIDNGADIHSSNNQALRVSAGSGFTQTVQILLAAGADVHANTDEALIRAVQHNCIGVVGCLLRMGADVHIHNNQPLRLACKLGYIDIANMLLLHGANVQEMNNEALHNAFEFGHIEIALNLLDFGADRSVAINFMDSTTNDVFRDTLKLYLTT